MNYPNGIKKRKINTNTMINYGNRGMGLENEINSTNEYYLNNNIAVIYKKPTPITITKVDYPSRYDAVIKEAYFKTPSTTDYNGIYKGKYIDFEAKETRNDTFPFANIYKHQIDHLKRVIDHGGIAFVIIAFTHRNEVYLIDASIMIDVYYHSNRKSITYETIKEKGHLIKQGFNPRLCYLDIIDEYYL